MSHLAVRGQPFPRTDTRYRGTDRESPGFREDLSPHHPWNLAVAELIRRDEFSTPSAGAATWLVDALQFAPAGSAFEVVEVTWHNEAPTLGVRLLGFDVDIDVAGSNSLLASVLLNDEAFNHPSPRGDRRMVELRSRFLDLLNENRLFATAADATAFLDAANSLGPWEGPEIVWNVVGIWEVAKPGS